MIAHGYRENSLLMASYIRMFHDLGYNVLAPDDRGAGRSEGHYITFGWQDRLDYQNWLKQLIAKKGQDSKDRSVWSEHGWCHCYDDEW